MKKQEFNIKPLVAAVFRKIAAKLPAGRIVGPRKKTRVKRA